MPEIAPTLQRRPLLHPWSAILVLGVDWLFFGADALSLGGSLLLSSIVAFVMTTVGVFWIQGRQSGDSAFRAVLKAVFAGAIAGLPTSIGGTVLGTLVLAMAGMRRGKNETGRRV